ncbi:MAG: MFS transporter [Marmoricola sp.]
MATGSMLAGVDYLARNVLEKPSAGTILFVCFVGPALLLTPLWAAFGQRVGKKSGFVIASLVLAAGALLAAGARAYPAWVVFLAVALGGGRVRRSTGLPDGDAARLRRA